MKENAPCPRSGELNPAFCGEVLPPGISGPRSTKWRPFSGISWTVFSAIAPPTETVAVSMSGDDPVTVTFSAIVARPRRIFSSAVCAGPRSIALVWSLNPSRWATTS
jgi:hypothetical protein